MPSVYSGLLSGTMCTVYSSRDTFTAAE